MLTSIALAATLLSQTAAVTVAKVQTFPTIKAISFAAPNTGTRFAVADYSNTVRIMDAATKATVFTMKGHPQPVYAMCYNPSGTNLVTGDESARIYVWDAKTGKKLREFARTAQTHQRGIQAITFSTDGKTMISTGKDDTIIVWDYATGKPKTRIQGNGVVFGSATFVGPLLYAATLTEGIHVRKTAGFALTKRLEGHGGQGVSEIVANRAGTRLISAGRDSKVGVWDPVSGKKLGSMVGHEDSVQHIAFAPNGRVCASSANDRKVILWNVLTMQKVALVDQQCAVGSPMVFTGDGRYLLTVNVSDDLQLNSVSPAQAPSTARPVRGRRG